MYVASTCEDIAFSSFLVLAGRGFPRSLARFLGVLKTRDTYEVSTSEVRARHVDVTHKVCRRYVGVNDTCQVRELACVKHVREDVPGTY